MTDRDVLIGRSFDVLEYLGNKRAEFFTGDMAEALEIHYRTALRWLQAAEARDFCSHQITRGRGARWKWTSNVECSQVNM
jgi:predicted ArsR family transcriptional regulator